MTAPQDIERAVPGLASLGSAHGANRADDGLCLRHDRLLPAGASCAWYARLLPEAPQARKLNQKDKKITKKAGAGGASLP